jgi:hypothetical protein
MWMVMRSASRSTTLRATTSLTGLQGGRDHYNIVSVVWPEAYTFADLPECGSLLVPESFVACVGLAKDRADMFGMRRCDHIIGKLEGAVGARMVGYEKVI